MIDTAKEILLSFSDLSSRLPRRPHTSTLHRWRLRGVRGVKLETILIGGRRYTSHEALERFFAATTAAASGETPPIRTPKQRDRAVAEAERELHEAGI